MRFSKVQTLAISRVSEMVLGWLQAKFWLVLRGSAKRTRSANRILFDWLKAKVRKQS